MNVADTREALTGNAVAVPTTIWKRAGVLDLEANARNAEFLFANGITSAVYAGGVGEHDLLSPEQQVVLLAAVAAAVRGKTENPCLATGLGRTLERVRQLAPALADLDIAFAMMMPPATGDPEEQFAYFSEVMGILTEHGIGPMLYPRPEHPMEVSTLERLMDVCEVPGVKLANNGMLLEYAEMVARLGHERTAWLCGTVGWWMPAYAAVGAARGMSTGIGNAFPDKPLDLLRRLADGSFERDDTYWTMVRIEQVRQRDKSYIALVIKQLQELAGLAGGMNGDGSELPAAVKSEVETLVRDACWLGGR
jgi:dihydrodipicolinate synthase/N-acetylneuraminate lyase